MTMATVTEQATTSLENRLVLAQVGDYTLAFPGLWVGEISRFQKTQILELPFYQSALLGLIHQNGQVIPLVAATHLLHIQQSKGKETTTMIRLSDATGKLAQVGVVVDKIIGSTTRPQVAEHLLESQDLQASFPEPGAMVLLRLEWFPQEVWQPQLWLT